MPSIVSATDAQDARSIALARAAREGKTGYYHYMRETLASVEVGGYVTLDADDLCKMNKRDKIETLPARIASLTDGAEMDKNTLKDIGAIRAACERELRSVTKDEKATLVSFFPATVNDKDEVVSVAYALKRTR